VFHLPGAGLSLLLGWSDTLQANIAREAARKFIADDSAYPGRYFFESHWGFEYYMQEGGVPYFNDTETGLHDRIAVPMWGSVNPQYNAHLARRAAAVEYKRGALGWVTTMHPALCAGFYSHTRGPLPFAFGPVPPEEFAVYQIEYWTRPGDN